MSARAAAPQAADYPEVTRADAGPFGTEVSGNATIVVLDYVDGRVYGVFDFIG